MSQLNVATIASKAAATAPVFEDSAAREIIQGCSAWITFDASSGSPVVGDSFNVSSVTDHAVGQFTVNFATAMANVNYAALGTGKGGIPITEDSSVAPTINGWRFIAWFPSTYYDQASNHIAFFGGL